MGLLASIRYAAGPGRLALFNNADARSAAAVDEEGTEETAREGTK